MSVMPLIRRCTRLVLLASLLAMLAACGGKVRPVSEGGSVSGQYDMVIDAYKTGQFLVDGAVLAAPDLGGHFAYLQSLGKVPKSVLLEDGSESRIRSTQLTEFAQLAAKYGFTGYIYHKGKLRPLQASDADG
ncbi:MAG TPA: hypothetical protein VFN09_11860 [Rhodanobacteraceae bacterium]|nr:hypothetical protein [Rhodanobacteraceae bacterium]